MPALSLDLPDAVAQRLEQAATSAGRTPAALMLDALCEHLDDLEDLALAEQRLADLRAGRSHTVSLEEVMMEKTTAHNGKTNK